MGGKSESDQPPGRPSELDLVVAEVVREAHVKAEALRPEERQYLKDHALKKPMGVLHIWALGVGVVITGEYFGWNQGLKEGGPIGMLLASLFVCVLYLMWVLALSELSVAMPFAGGPLAYGRRAVGPTVPPRGTVPPRRTVPRRRTAPTSLSYLGRPTLVMSASACAPLTASAPLTAGAAFAVASAASPTAAIAATITRRPNA